MRNLTKNKWESGHAAGLQGPGEPGGRLPGGMIYVDRAAVDWQPEDSASRADGPEPNSSGSGGGFGSLFVWPHSAGGNTLKRSHS